MSEKTYTYEEPWNEEILLDPQRRNFEVLNFEKKLSGKIVGQDRAVRKIVNLYQTYLSEMSLPNHPIGNLLFLGPTGSGKTRVVEASAEILFGNPKAFIKIDCAEFQHGHEIAKLVGSPPGYLGHRETPPLLNQAAIDQHQTSHLQMSFILFDEIEKANESLWQLLLGILDKATLTLGDNRKVDLSRCIIFMSSNLGGKKISNLISGENDIGFVHKPVLEIESGADQKIYHAALEEAKRNFSPEFMNRVDHTVVFRTLTREHLQKILDIELLELSKRIEILRTEKRFVFRCTPEAKEFLLREGTDLKYGARHLKRALERHLVYPLSNLIATEQIGSGEGIKIDFDARKNKLKFIKEKSYSLP